MPWHALHPNDGDGRPLHLLLSIHFPPQHRGRDEKSALKHTSTESENLLHAVNRHEVFEASIRPCPVTCRCAPLLLHGHLESGHVAVISSFQYYDVRSAQARDSRTNLRVLPRSTLFLVSIMVQDAFICIPSHILRELSSRSLRAEQSLVPNEHHQGCIHQQPLYRSRQAVEP